MSSISGLGAKGEKNKGKFKSIDINTLYKGKSVETQKSAGKCAFSCFRFFLVAQIQCCGKFSVEDPVCA